MRIRSQLSTALMACLLIATTACSAVAQSHTNNHLGINGIHYLPLSIFSNLVDTVITPDPNAANLSAIPTAEYVNSNSVTFTESNVDIPAPCVTTPTICSSGGGSLFESNGHKLLFSADGGATPYAFQEDTAFDISFNMSVTSIDPLNRKGIGFHLDSDPGGTNNVTQFTAQTTNNLFGGTPPGQIGASGSTLLPNLPLGNLYTDGNTVRMRIIYIPPERDGGGVLVTAGTLEYQADTDPNNLGGEFTTGALTIASHTVNGKTVDGGIADGSNFGLRVQVVADNSSDDSYTTVFSDFQILNPLDDADFNEDGFVNGLDFLIWQQNLGLTGTASLADGDANQDMNVDSLDLTIWENQYGVSPPSVAAVASVPEPGTAVLMTFALAVSPLSRRFRSV